VPLHRRDVHACYGDSYQNNQKGKQQVLHSLYSIQFLDNEKLILVQFLEDKLVDTAHWICQRVHFHAVYTTFLV
jgi:hypothetical protein